MHLCFVYESRTPSKPDLSGSEYFVIGGVVIPDEKWKDIADKLKGLKQSEQYKGELKWRFFASPDRINFSMSASVFGAWVQCLRADILPSRLGEKLACRSECLDELHNICAFFQVIEYYRGLFLGSFDLRVTCPVLRGQVKQV